MSTTIRLNGVVDTIELLDVSGEPAYMATIKVPLKVRSLEVIAKLIDDDGRIHLSAEASGRDAEVPIDA